jgi:hypothetical protein
MTEVSLQWGFLIDTMVSPANSLIFASFVKILNSMFL